MTRFLKAALATTILAGATLGSIAHAETTLFFGEAGPNRGARAEALNWFVEDVKTRTEGELTFDVQWGGALFKADAAAQAVADGVADAGTIIGVYFPQEMLAYGIADLPVQNPDPWVGMKATDELMRGSEAIQANLADQNLVYLGTYTTSAVHIGCKGKAIRTVEDIDGLKVRGVGAYGKTFADFGANLVNMSIYDAYQGLDSGLLDCSQGYSYAVGALNQQEVMDSYTMLNWGQVGALGIFMNKDAYDSLPEDQQQALMEAGEGLSDEFGRLVNADNDAAVEKMREAGVEIIELPEEERAKLVEKGNTYLEEWSAQADAAGLDGQALLEEYRGLIDKYQAEVEAEGYPWERG